MTRFVMQCLILCAGAVTAGCSSIHSTHVKRNEEACGWSTKHLHGIPITLDVPEKIKVEIVETQYFHTKSKRIVHNVNDGKPIVARAVNVAVDNKKEIFTVDFVKPGAGTLTTSVDLDVETQYFKEINNKIVDTTLDSITAAINTIGSSIPTVAGGKSSGFNPQAFDDKVLTAVSKTVAIGVFDINDRQVLEKIHVFLCQHLNGCTDTCVQHVYAAPAPQPLPPGKTSPNATAPFTLPVPPVPQPLPLGKTSPNATAPFTLPVPPPPQPLPSTKTPPNPTAPFTLSVLDDGK